MSHAPLQLFRIERVVREHEHAALEILRGR
jgi:hypothetical protein